MRGALLQEGGDVSDSRPGATGPQRRSVMKTQAQIKIPTDTQDIGESRLMQTRNRLEKDLNFRLNKISSLVDKLGTVPYYVWLEKTVQTCDRAQDLRVKVEAVRWMLRIAKHLNSVAREMVMSTIDKTLDDLERVVASEMHARNAVRAA